MIDFPAVGDGNRSSSAVGRDVLSAALAGVDPVGARAAQAETTWRSGYLTHFRRALEAGLGSADAARDVASRGLAALHDTMVVHGNAGEDRPLSTWSESSETHDTLGTATVTGTGEPEETFSLPYRGERLRGDDLLRQIDTWVSAGVAEPSLATAIRELLEHPEWLRLEGRTVAVLGAGAEMGPLQALLHWGATVAAVDLPRPAIWKRLVELGQSSAGTLLLPGIDHGTEAHPDRLGADLIREVPAVGDWLAGLDGEVVLGNYVYADGATNLKVSMAVDALTVRLLAARPETALAFLATPTDVFAVPHDAVAQSTVNWEHRRGSSKLVGRPLRALSRGRLLQRQYLPTADPGVNDSLVPQQGPNYALAKRLQRWRATDARAQGRLVSLNVAPPTRTRSVVKNRALAAAYAGAHRFGVEVFEPATSNVLMAGLLVHDLHTGGGPGGEEPWQAEAHAAVHGGLWRTAYAPRSALGLAAVLGLGAARG